jgi:hypothetical protein
MTTILNSDADLFYYLTALADLLASRGAVQLAEKVRIAARMIAGNIITEFRGESRIALWEVVAQENGILNAAERADLIGVIRQLDAVLPK